MKQNGWIKIYRDMLDNPIVMKDSDHLAVWIWLLLHATSKKRAVMFGGKQRYLRPGEMTTGRRVIASELHISQSKVQRILKSFENEHQIEQRTDRQCRLISIVNWVEYQQSEQRNEQRVNNDRTTSEQRVNTKQEWKECKNEREDTRTPTLAEIKEYVERLGYSMDPSAFFDYYEETEWHKKNGQPIKDWKASVRTWERREKQFKSNNNNKSVIEPPKYKEFEPEPRINAVEMPDEIRNKVKEVLK